jgi:NTP pyrophosphatase (non-canonical NTP hydrolase)
MDKEQVKARLHDAMHRGRTKATEEELGEVAAVVLAVVGEVTVELSALIADLAERVAALEAKT